LGGWEENRGPNRGKGLRRLKISTTSDLLQQENRVEHENLMNGVGLAQIFTFSESSC
jgi:hypothetical protein